MSGQNTDVSDNSIVQLLYGCCMVADLCVFFAGQLEAALLLGQLGNPLQHAFPLLDSSLLSGCQAFCHGLHINHHSSAIFDANNQYQVFNISV